MAGKSCSLEAAGTLSWLEFLVGSAVMKSASEKADGGGAPSPREVFNKKTF